MKRAGGRKRSHSAWLSTTTRIESFTQEKQARVFVQVRGIKESNTIAESMSNIVVSIDEDHCSWSWPVGWRRAAVECDSERPLKARNDRTGAARPWCQDSDMLKRTVCYGCRSCPSTDLRVLALENFAAA